MGLTWAFPRLAPTGDLADSSLSKPSDLQTIYVHLLRLFFVGHTVPSSLVLGRCLYIAM